MTIPLGFEFDTGHAIKIPVRHMAVIGQTQLSGKTTTMEALIERSRLRAIAFITKRGEGSFQSSSAIPAFFQERADWEFIESILESTMKQRMKFERAWLVRACKGANNLADVQRNLDRLMEKSKRSMDKDIFMLLGEYLNKVVPLIRRLPKSERVNIEPGLNVMDLAEFPEELQMLVVSSTLRWIHQHDQGVVTLIPEAWKFVPRGRKTPVKMEVERLIREGAGLHNFVWLDSQDITGVETTILKQVTVWLLGVQREFNEVKRTLASIPSGTKRPREGDIGRLGVGEFFACFDKHVHRVYVQPPWLDEDAARDVALGKRAVEDIRPKPVRHQSNASERVIPHREERIMPTVDKAKLLKRAEKIKQELADIVRALGIDDVQLITTAPIASLNTAPVDLDAIYDHVRQRLMGDPQLLHLAVARPEIEIEIVRPVVKLDHKTLRGRLAEFVASGFFDEATTGNAAFNELKRRGFSTAKPNVYRELDALTAMGFLTKESNGYQIVVGMKVNIIKQ